MATAATVFACGLLWAQGARAQEDGDISEPESDGGVTPLYYDGNPDCYELGYSRGFKPQDEGGDYNGGDAQFEFPGDILGNVVDVSSDGTFLAWSSTLGIDAVIVKGGPNANSYVYEPPEESYGDSGLAPPINNEEPYGLSHVEFCYDYEVAVEKSAAGRFVRTSLWTIEKTSDVTDLVLAMGQAFLVDYTVDVSATNVDTDFGAFGTITIVNADPDFDAIIEAVDDIVDPDIAATVWCDELLPFVLGPGETLECSYDASLPDNTERVNTATVTTSIESLVGGGHDTAVVTFGDPTTTVDACVDVSDDQYGPLGFVCEDTTFEYTLDVGSYDVCGDYSFVNVASFVTDNTGQTGSDDHVVTAMIHCDCGCTLTQGYWKTHSEYGPAPYDDAWALLASGADTPFFNSGMTWYEVLWTPPAGNAFYNLAHQYVAAALNVLNEAKTRPNVTTAILNAEVLFNAQGIGDTTLTAAERKAAIRFASTLDKFNNGLIDTPHCDEYDSMYLE